MITTDGKPIKEGLLRQSARYLGHQGGYLSQNDPDTITGSQRGWQLPLPPKTPYQPAQTKKQPKPPCYEETGHLASLSLLYDSDRLRRSALLHRTTTPHQKEELTQMETNLNLQEHHISFKQDHYTGALRASKMEITSTDPGQPKQQVTLACDATNPTITINRGSEETLEITATKISFPRSLPPKSPTAVQAYSPPELHSYWNKVAYYELSDQQETESFTQYLCQQPAAPGSGAPTLGRLFMLGFKKQRITQLYFCATNQAGQQAHLLQEMEPPK